MEKTPKGNQGSPEQIKLAEKNLTEAESDASRKRENRLMNIAFEKKIEEEVAREILRSYKVTGDEVKVISFEIKGRKIQIEQGALYTQRGHSGLCVNGQEVSKHATRLFLDKYADLLESIAVFILAQRFEAYWVGAERGKWKFPGQKKSEQAIADGANDYLVRDLL